MPPVAVETYKADPTPFARAIQAVGSLSSPQSADLAFEVGGRVAEIDIPEGKPIAKGHLLARLDNGTHRAQVAVAKARLDQALETAGRYQSLQQEKIVSQQNLDDALAELRSAQGDYDAAESALRKTRVAAPFDGIVGLKEVSVGQFVDPGTPVVRITQIKPLDLVFSLPEKNVPKVQVGQKVRATTAGCAVAFEGVVAAVDPAIDPVSRTARVQASIPNEAGTLRPGMSADVTLEFETVPDALVVPQEALIREGGKLRVAVAKEDGSFEFREVEPSDWSRDKVRISKGLSAGEQVIASGHQKLRPGAKVAPSPYKPIQNSRLDEGKGGCPPAAP